MSEVRSREMPLTERDIKEAVIAHLAQRAALLDGVVINELPVANWSRRADLAVANGKLQAFEIKSDRDSLRRLDAQISLFSTRFDKVTVVTTSRFIEAAKERLPSYIEIWHATRDDTLEVALRVVRRGQTREIKNRGILSSYLQKSELAIFLRSEGHTIGANASREELEQLLSESPLTRLRAFVLSRLKQRYRSGQENPLRTRASRSGIATQSNRRATPSGSNDRASDTVSLSERFESFGRKFGQLPSDMPASVARRRPRG